MAELLMVKTFFYTFKLNTTTSKRKNILELIAVTQYQVSFRHLSSGIQHVIIWNVIWIWAKINATQLWRSFFVPRL